MNLAWRSRALAIESDGAAFTFEPLLLVIARHRKQIKWRDWEEKPIMRAHQRILCTYRSMGITSFLLQCSAVIVGVYS